MTGGFGGLVEARIGHHHGAGEIIGERDAQQAPGDVVLRLEPRADRVDQRAMLAYRQLIGHLKRAARLVHDLGNQELAAVQVVPAQLVAHDVDRQQADADAMAPAQPLRHHVERLGAFQREVGGDALGEVVEFGKMIAVVVQDRADALDRGVTDHGFGAVRVGVGEDTGLARLPGRGVSAIQPLHGGYDGGGVFRRVVQLGAGDRGIPEERVGQHLLQPFDRLAGAVLHELAGVDAVDVREAHEHGHGYGALVALHQIQIARRYGELFGHPRLGQPALPPQPLETWPREDLAGREIACREGQAGEGRGVEHVKIFTHLQSD